MTTIDNKWVKKLIYDFKSEGVTFSPDQDETNVYETNQYHRLKLIGTRKLDNVVFEKDGIKVKIYNDLFYRVSGIVNVYKDGEKNTIEVIRVTDEMFYKMQKDLITYLFKIRSTNG